MRTETIEEVYARNAALGERLKMLVDSLPKEKLNHLPDGEKWTICNIVEHISIVESSIVKICAKLLSKAESDGTLADGAISVSDAFGRKALEIATTKLEAPDFVKPTGEAKVEDSLRVCDENRQKLDEIKPLFEKFDSNIHKFPHPYFGDLSAGEWLNLLGGHKMRHIKQIERLAEGI
jgi:hypothetical protein